MGDIEYFVLVIQATMADFYKTAGMPWMIGAVDGLWITCAVDHMIRNICMCAIKMFMP